MYIFGSCVHLFLLTTIIKISKYVILKNSFTADVTNLLLPFEIDNYTIKFTMLILIHILFMSLIKRCGTNNNQATNI